MESAFSQQLMLQDMAGTGKRVFEAAREKFEILKSRTWKNIKFCLKNMIDARRHKT